MCHVLCTAGFSGEFMFVCFPVKQRDYKYGFGCIRSQKGGRKREWMDEWMHRWVDVGQSTVQPTARACASVHVAIFDPLAAISLIATEETDASSRCGDTRHGLMLNFRCACRQRGYRRADGTGGEKNRLRPARYTRTQTLHPSHSFMRLQSHTGTQTRTSRVPCSRG